MSTFDFSIRIPKEREESLEKLINLSDKKFEELINALNKVPPTVSPRVLARKVADVSNIPFEDVNDIFTILFEFYYLYNEKQIKPEQIADLLIESVQRIENAKIKTNKDNISKLRNRLTKMFSNDNSLTITSKAIDICNQHQKVFSRSRIFTDIRPVFDSKISDDNPNTIILHMLKLAYYENEMPQDTYLTLDINDLRQLRDQIDRAIEKENLLKVKINNLGLKNIDIAREEI